MSKTRNVIASALLLVGGATAGRLSAPAEKVTREVTVKERPAPTVDSALCFTLDGLKHALGPKGESSVRIFATDAGNMGGELIVDRNKVASAITSLETALDPQSDSTVQRTDANVEALAAESTANAALPAVDNESTVLGQLSNDQLLHGGGSQASKNAAAMLDQARTQIATALDAASCNPNYYQQNPDIVSP